MIKTRSKTGEAISLGRRTATARKHLRRFIKAAADRSDLAASRRGRAILGYIEGRRVIELAAELDVTRGAINRWLQWYEACGVQGLLTGKAPGAAPNSTRLSLQNWPRRSKLGLSLPGTGSASGRVR